MISYEKNQGIPDEAWYRQSITDLQSSFPEVAKGYFGPESITWKIYREPGILLGSHRALLLQIAHPAVAAGVKQYSNFQKDYLGRAHRTFLNMATIFFGSTRTAEKTAGHLHQMHYRIKGQYANAQKQPQDFCANQPELLTWILATLVDTSIVAYELLQPPLSLAEKEQFIQESKATAQLMGIPSGFYPENYEAFSIYMQEMLAGDALFIGDTARELAADILRGPFPVGRSLIQLFATALLPDTLRKAYCLPWDAKREERFSKRLTFLRRLYHLVPRALRYAPPYYQAQYRLAVAQRKKRSFLPSFFHWLGDHINTPFLITND